MQPLRADFDFTAQCGVYQCFPCETMYYPMELEEGHTCPTCSEPTCKWSIDAQRLPRLDSGLLQSYSWPGGYPLFYLDSENNVSCPACANHAERHETIAAFRPVLADANYEDPDLTCDQCSATIEAAYV